MVHAMIPKTAWIHWANPPMPWLRRQSIESFKKHNPDWQVWQVGTPEDIRAYGMSYAHEADWTWWRLLRDHGGFLIASDTVTLRPMPDEWLDAEMCAQVSDGDVYQFAALGCVPNHPMMKEVNEVCAHRAPRLRGASPGQQLGVETLKQVSCGAIERFPGLLNMPMDGYCFYNWDTDPWGMWTVDGPGRVLPDTAIGIHWYGGHEATRKEEPTADPAGQRWIERVARSAA